MCLIHFTINKITKFLFCVWFQKCCLVFQNVTIFNKINSYKYKTTIKLYFLLQYTEKKLFIEFTKNI